MRLYETVFEDARTVYTEPTLAVAVGRPAPWLFLSRVDGHLSAAGAKRIGDAILAMAAIEKHYLVFFHDWSKMTDYDGQARVLLTDVARTVLPACEGIHVYVTTPRVAFGVRAASLILGKITIYGEVEPFGNALLHAVENPTRLCSA